MKEVVQNMRSGCSDSSSVIYTSSLITANFSSSSNIPKEVESIQEGVNNSH